MASQLSGSWRTSRRVDVTTRASCGKPERGHLVGGAHRATVALPSRRGFGRCRPPRRHLANVCSRLEPFANSGGRRHREAYISTQPASPGQEARFPGSYEHPRGARCAEVTSCQGPRPSVGLIHRIRTRAEFDHLGRAGRRVRNDVLWCSYLPDPAISPPRVAFAIGRAQGPAVVRNRLRRRLRPILSALSTAHSLPNGHLLVGINRSKIDQMFAMTTDDLTATVADLLHRATQPGR